MTRAFVVVLDSVGCGGAPDAAAFGDEGANTLGHIVQTRGHLHVPNLASLGLGEVLRHGTGIKVDWTATRPAWAVATEVSMGKDTPSGHWELAGVPVPWEWHYFPDETPAFPTDILQLVHRHAGGSLANCHASGTVVIDEFAPQHLQTGHPICYTSADSVFQIAAHEETFGLEKLYDLCRALAPTLHGMRVGRVIARPFVGDAQAGWTRTSNRKDFAIPPPGDTICDIVSGAGGAVHAIGKIGDIFSMRGIDRCRKGDDRTLMTYLMDEMENAPDGALVFANFVEFDTDFGHRRDVEGYARHLEWFDREIGPVLAKAKDDDLIIFTADHGNDPTWHGTDHTREQVPVLVQGPASGFLGDIGFKDVGAMVLKHLGVAPTGKGTNT